jgi:hypothetical protein
MPFHAKSINLSPEIRAISRTQADADRLQLLCFAPMYKQSARYD